MKDLVASIGEVGDSNQHFALGDSSIEVYGRCMEKHTKTQHVFMTFDKEMPLKK